ncbi:MAG: hypothetical protein ACTTH0_04480 [Eubacteriales bacterium]
MEEKATMLIKGKSKKLSTKMAITVSIIAAIILTILITTAVISSRAMIRTGLMGELGGACGL